MIDLHQCYSISVTPHHGSNLIHYKHVLEIKNLKYCHFKIYITVVVLKAYEQNETKLEMKLTCELYYFYNGPGDVWSLGLSSACGHHVGDPCSIGCVK